ncbi:unnamed protein product [Brugia pahangi]|uniref:Uncharacterized protein n=1 Tax=Brugia pahangi TaxID=6280 RepID=A0A0N4TIJ1_BRUPA|nr:unnamed protein product [Brugia pahangi]
MSSGELGIVSERVCMGILSVHFRISEVTVVATENNCHINMILGRRRSRGLVPTVTT